MQSYPITVAAVQVALRFAESEHAIQLADSRQKERDYHGSLQTIVWEVYASQCTHFSNKLANCDSPLLRLDRLASSDVPIPNNWSSYRNDALNRRVSNIRIIALKPPVTIMETSIVFEIISGHRTHDRLNESSRN